MAALSDLSVRTIQRLERGNGASAETLKAVAAVFEVDFTSLKENTMAQPDSYNVSLEEKLAFRKVRALKSFYIRVAAYIVIAGVLTAYNLIHGPHYFWAGWVIFGFAVATFINGMKVYDKAPFLSGTWEKAKVEKYLGRKL